MNNEKTCALGIDFGTESARALLIDAQTGEIIATAVEPYPNGVIDTALPGGAPLGPDWALQNPSDWLHALESTVRRVLAESGVDPQTVRGIGIDFTSCTVLPVKENGAPLSLFPAWRPAPNAWPKLWKHHAAQPYAERITRLAAQRGEPWLARYGGIISSEWLLPKALQILEEDPHIYAAADLIVEGGDWVAWQLTGNFVRNACAAGFKGLWHKAEGYPSAEYLAELHPDFRDFYTTRGQGRVAPPGETVGSLTPEWASRLGLGTHTKVAVGIIDAHAGAIGAGVTQSGVLYMAMGTSTCHMLLAEEEKKRAVVLNAQREVAEALSRLSEAQAQLVSLKEARAKAKEAFRVESLRYRSGAGTVTDMLLAQAAWLEAEAAYLEALYRLVQAQIAYQRATATIARGYLKLSCEEMNHGPKN